MNIIERLFLRKTLGKYNIAIQENIRFSLGTKKNSTTYYISIDNLHLDKRVAEKLDIKYSTYRKLLLSINGSRIIDENVEFTSVESARTAIKSILGVLYIIAQQDGIKCGKENPSERDAFMDMWQDNIFKE